MNLIDLVPSRRAVRRVGRRAILEGALAQRRRTGDRPPPDFVIVGAQRCGTTSLFHALADHPAVMRNVLGAKGVHYFDTNASRSPEWFFAHFPTQEERDEHEARVGHPAIVGEASPYYLFHPAAIARMSELVPDGRLIVLLRDPIGRAYSHYQHMVWEGHEPLETFEEALDREEERIGDAEARLARDPSHRSPGHQHFAYTARGQYADQLERLFEHYPREQVLIMAIDDLTGDPPPHLEQIQRFIGLEPSPKVHLEQRNAGTYDPLRPETRARLTEVFADSNARLEAITGHVFPWT